jgi:hypothetical protein
MEQIADVIWLGKTYHAYRNDEGQVVISDGAPQSPSGNRTRDAAQRLTRLEKNMRRLRSRDDEAEFGNPTSNEYDQYEGDGRLPAQRGGNGIRSGDDQQELPAETERGEHVITLPPGHYEFFEDARGIHIHKARQRDHRDRGMAGRTGDQYSADRRAPTAVLLTNGQDRESHCHQLDRLNRYHEEFWRKQVTS